MRFKKVLAGMLALSVALTGIPSMPAFAANGALDAAPVLELKFEENLEDTSAKHATVTANQANVSYTEGASGKAVAFDGGTWLDLGKDTALSPEKMTLSFWINPQQKMSGEHIITWNKNEYYTDGWYLSSEGDNVPLALSVGPAATNGQPYKIAIDQDRSKFFPAGQWTHIVVTYDSADKEAVFYRNGIRQQATVKYPVTDTSTGVVGPCPEMKKTIGFNGPVYNGSFIKAALDEYRLYDRVIGLEGVVALYEDSGRALDKKAIAQSDLDAINIPTTATRRVSLPAAGVLGSSIHWETSHPEVIALDGTVTPPETGTVQVELTARVSFVGGEAVSKVFPVSVTAKSEQVSDAVIDSGIENVSLQDSFLVHASQKESEYLLSLSSKKFLYEFYRVSGLTPPTTDRYQGWERSNDVNFRGHTFGHYMSALSQSYAGTQDAGTKERLLSEIRDAVEGLKECQDAYAAKNPGSAGYVSAFRESILNQIDGTGSSDENVIVPWYNLHKVLAGLIDIYTFIDEKQLADEALGIAERFSEYVYVRCSRLKDNTVMLRTEYGGMNEALYEIYDITGNEHYKEAAQYFDEVSLLNSLAARQDILDGKHANTTIPKLTGALKRYTVLTGNEEYYENLTNTEKDDLEKFKNAAINFWDIVVEHHTYVTGGNSQSEHFHAPDALYADATKADYDGALTCETCNTYNMLKLSRELYKLTKDKKYMDYYENTYINAILSSQNPETGTTMYFQPMAPGYNKVFNRPVDEFWCCTGTGMENFSKLGDTIYFTEKSDVYVNMYFSSSFAFAKQNVKLVQEANMPNQEEVTVKVTALDGKDVAGNTNLRFRIPDWTAGEPELSVNGAKQEIQEENGYAVVSNVKANDTITLRFPMEVKAYATQDNRSFVAFKYGPVVLSTALGTKDIEASSPNGILVRVGTKDNTCQSAITVSDTTVPEWMENVKENLVRIEDSADGQVQFKLLNTDSPDLIYTPHFMRYKERYGLYMTFEEQDSKASQERILAKKRVLRDEEISMDTLTSFDENNSEFAKNLTKSENSGVGSFGGRTFRHAPGSGWFAYDLQINPEAEHNYLVCTWYSGDKGRNFELLINGEQFQHIEITDAAGQNVFYPQSIEIPEKYWKDPQYKMDSKGEFILDENGEKIPVVNVKFQGNGSSYVGGLFGIKTVDTTEYDTNPNLSALQFDVGKLSPGLSDEVAQYTLTVPKGTKSVEMKAAGQKASSLLYIGDVLFDDTQPRNIHIASFPQTVTLTATAQDHETAKEYTISIVESDEVVKQQGSLTISCNGFTYNGKASAAPKVTSTTNTGAAVTYQYYSDAACTRKIASPVHAGTYYVRGTAKETETHTAAISNIVSFTIRKAKVTSATVTGIKTMYYTGKAITQPGLKVKGYKAGTDYTLSYSNNKKVGKAVVTIKFQGDYTGSIQKTFQIKKQIPGKGKIYKSGNIKYKVTKSAASGGTVEVSAPAKKTYTSISVPSTVKLNGYTFQVTSIGQDAFKKNQKLSKVTIGANVTKIGKNAFSSCSKLKKITVKSKKLKSVGKNAFKGIHSKAVITVPKAKKSAYKKLLGGKGQKKTVKIK
ncbi:beta-L-arabinofuranosidase domain-containing protein [Lachnospiraceae bacterium 29-84]